METKVSFKEMKDIAKTYKKLIKGNIKVDELFIENDIHKEAFKKYIKAEAETVCNKLSSPNEYAFFNVAMDDNYKYFLNLKPEQYTEEATYKFISCVLKGCKLPNMRVKNTFDNKLMLINSVKTSEGSQISYYDKKLELPVSLMYETDVYFKVLKPLTFLKIIDCDIKEFGPNFVAEKLSYFVKESMSQAILEVLGKHEFDYYELINNKEEVKNAVINNINKFVEKGALEIVQIDIQNIDFVQEISEKLQEIGFNNKIKREELSNELRYEKESLELYGEKVKIHANNPGVEWNLSEFEKDKALERYMIKNGMNPEIHNVSLGKKSLTKQARKEDITNNPIKNIILNKSFRSLLVSILFAFLTAGCFTFAMLALLCYSELGIGYFPFGIISLLVLILNKKRFYTPGLFGVLLSLFNIIITILTFVCGILLVCEGDELFAIMIVVEAVKMILFILAYPKVKKAR